eukprot:SAG22_NODE_22025_length_252_cov_0.666667_1_plen_41_part_01
MKFGRIPYFNELGGLMALKTVRPIMEKRAQNRHCMMSQLEV